MPALQKCKQTARAADVVHMPLSVPQARRIAATSDAHFHDRVRAVSTIASDDDGTTLPDLLLFLPGGGVPARLAACALYRRTGRVPTPDHPDDYVIDIDDWVRFIESGERTRRRAPVQLIVAAPEPAPPRATAEKGSDPVSRPLSHPRRRLIGGIAGTAIVLAGMFAATSGAFTVGAGLFIAGNIVVAAAALVGRRAV